MHTPSLITLTMYLHTLSLTVAQRRNNKKDRRVFQIPPGTGIDLPVSHGTRRQSHSLIWSHLNGHKRKVCLKSCCLQFARTRTHASTRSAVTCKREDNSSERQRYQVPVCGAGPTDDTKEDGDESAAAPHPSVCVHRLFWARTSGLKPTG